MKDYTFDMVLRAAFTVQAESQEEAERIVNGPFDCATIHILENGEIELEGEASLEGEPVLGMIDGKEAA